MRYIRNKNAKHGICEVSSDSRHDMKSKYSMYVLLATAGPISQHEVKAVKDLFARLSVSCG